MTLTGRFLTFASGIGGVGETKGDALQY